VFCREWFRLGSTTSSLFGTPNFPNRQGPGGKHRGCWPMAKVSPWIRFILRNVRGAIIATILN
jgi:hypothetical protein